MGRITSEVLSFTERLSRGAFIVRLGLASAIFTVLFVFLNTTMNAAATWLLYPPLFWMALAWSVRRLHDRDRSAWWLLVALVPILGPLWLFVDLCLRGGTPGDNTYGADPRLASVDYLTVA